MPCVAFACVAFEHRLVIELPAISHVVTRNSASLVRCTCVYCNAMIIDKRCAGWTSMLHEFCLLEPTSESAAVAAQDRIARYGAPTSVTAAPSAGSSKAVTLPMLSVLTWNLWFQVRMPFS